MYEQSFQLSSRPFTSTPFVKHYYPAESIQKSLSSARLCIDRGSGPVVVIGDTGTGKSLLLAMLEEQYRGQFSVINLACARLEQRQELLQSILFELQLPYRTMTEGELRLSLMDYLKPSQACPNGVLLLIDEAQNLPVELLDEVRLLTNFVREGQPRVRLVMAGNQGLEEQLTNRKLESFNHRIAARCYLTALSQSETADYVITHLDRAGGDGNQTFGQRALRAIHELSEGCPRFVNQICDHALILAATRGVSTINESMVREAWADVQSLPNSFTPNRENTTLSSPIQTSEESSSSDESWTVIEFGNLDDEDEDRVQPPATVELDETQATSSPFSDHESSDEAHEPAPGIQATKYDATRSLTEADDVGDELSGTIQPDHARPTSTIVDEGSDCSDETTDRSHESVDVTKDSETSGTQSTRPTESLQNPADPFCEDFDDEEEIIDRYLPLVAAHNQSSLRMTKDELSYLQPLDAYCDSNDDDQKPQPSGEDRTQVQDVDSDEIAREADEILETLNRAKTSKKQLPNEDFRVSHETDFGRSGNVSSTFKMSDHAANSEAVSFFDDEDSAEEGLSKQDVADRELLKGIIEDKNRATAARFGEQHSNDRSSEQSKFNADECSDQLDGGFAKPKSNPAATPSSQSSPQLSSHRSGSFSLHDNFEEEELPEPPINRDAVVQAPESSEDDQDILIIDRPTENYSQPKPNPPQIPFPATPVSTGQAKRMDYQQLFDQLRSTLNE